MPRSRRRPAPRPKVLYPTNYNVAVRGALYRVYARPLVPARTLGHPFRNKTVFDITHLVESVSWNGSTEEGGAIVGSVVVRNPGNFLGVLVAGSRIIIKQANPFVSNVDANSLRKRRYVTILDLIVQEREKQQTEQLLSLSLGDRLTYLNKGKRTFKFVKKKGRKAPTASTIIRKVCTDERIPWTKASIPATTIAINKAAGEGTTVLAFFTKVLKLHNQLVDKRNGKNPPPPNWDIHMRTGLLTIRPKRPPKSVWYISERNFVGEPSYRESTKGFATRVIAKGKRTTYREKKNKDGTTSKRKKSIKKNLTITVTNEAMAAVYGLITHEEKVSGNVTPERLERIANAVLAKKTRMTRELTFTCPALPNIWPGGKVFLDLRSYGMHGLFAVKSIEYSVTGIDGPMMTLTVDAGSVAITNESTGGGKPAAIKGIRRPSLTSVKVFYEGGKSTTYEHPKRWKIASVQAVTAANAKRLGRDPKDEVGLVEIRFVNGKRHEIPPAYTYPKGLVAVTDEGYIPARRLT